jgi:ubiquinone/menaquinone biosynthesis C-methylase UbiE
MQEILESIAKYYSGFDADFFRRVWGTGTDVYLNRLRAIGFSDQARVLDAGFGMGQWLYALSTLNRKVVGVDSSSLRVEVTSQLLRRLGIANAELHCQSIEKLDFADNSFDAVFCYGVLFLTDFRKSLREMYRVLAPGGKLYFTANGLGWFLFCLIEEHNKSPSYDPRQMAADAIENSLHYFTKGEFECGKQLVIPSRNMSYEVKEVGFTTVTIGPEGSLNPKGVDGLRSFYEPSYLGNETVYEVLAVK